jgi:enterochelin esterase-like enzyme
VLPFGAAIERDVHSADAHEYTFAAVAGDLIAGTMEVRTVAGILELRNGAGAVIHTDYFYPEEHPTPRRIGFVTSATGTYRLQFRAFDRFDGGPAWRPGEPKPVAGSIAGSYRLLLDRTAISARMQDAQGAARQTYSSPRMQRLAQEVAGGSATAIIDAFWREVAGKGPLVEDVPKNDRDVDVTFLWRALYETRNVLVTWCPRPEDCYMSHLAGTDVWYKTLQLRRGSRLPYLISPNDRPQDRWATQQLDPLNARKFPDDPTYRFFSQSILDVPGGPDEHWALRTPVRRGLIEEKKVTSALLNFERDIWVYTPPGYTRTGGPYPLVVLFDGAAYVSDRFVNAPATLDNLINDGRIRPTIVCFDPGNRPRATGLAGAKKYGDALLQELLPSLHKDYAISTNPADIVIGGYSAGGLAAAQIAFLHPEAFGNVLSQSGAFRAAEANAAEPNETARIYLGEPHKPIRFYIEAGVYDNVPNADRPLHEFVLDETNLQGNRHVRDVLRAKGYDVIYREVPGDHDMVHWRAMLADGLIALLSK